MARRKQKKTKMKARHPTRRKSRRPKKTGAAARRNRRRQRAMREPELIPSDIYSRPWWFYENYMTTPEQAKAKWMREYEAGLKPVFWEHYERSRSK